MARSFFSPQFLDELKSKSDIVDTVSKYVPLKRSGREFVGCCPFHHEKTPSFYVYPEGQNYHCYGCKAGGDVIKFIQQYENLGFVESVEKLANDCNMAIPEIKNVDFEQITKSKQEKDLILAALKDAAKYYYKNLFIKHSQAEKARNYLLTRQINSKSIAKFGIGCSLDFDSAIRYLRGKGYSAEILKQAGLLSTAESRTFDAFGKRLTFPLFDSSGAVIGFSARLLENKELAKYKNTSNTPVFNKSKVIFGINLIKKLSDELRKAGNAGLLENLILVEGQIDVITMHQYGFTNTVACLGTAITPSHARELARQTNNIIMLMDGDGAGRKSAVRSVDILRSAGLNVSVAELPDGFDPDEYLHKFGADALQMLLYNVVDGIKYKIKVLADSFDISDNNQKSRFIQECLVVIKSVTDITDQDIYLQIVAGYSKIQEESLRAKLATISETEKPYYERENDEQSEEIFSLKLDGNDLANLNILATCLNGDDFTTNINIDDLKFEDKGLNETYRYILNARGRGQKPTVSGLYSAMDVDSSTPLVKELMQNVHLSKGNPELIFKINILKNKLAYLEYKKLNLNKSLAEDKHKSIAEKMDKLVQSKELKAKELEYKQEIDKLEKEYYEQRNTEK